LSPAFAAQCAGCHGSSGEGQGPFPSLLTTPDADAFVSVVRTGRNQMPPFDEAAAPEARLRRDFVALQRASLSGEPAAPAPAADPACGPGRRELPPSSADERAARIERGLAAYRKPGPKGACAGCHSALAIDLAFIGFSDADILRRAIPQVGVSDARPSSTWSTPCARNTGSTGRCTRGGSGSCNRATRCCPRCRSLRSTRARWWASRTRPATPPSPAR
jgi:mono/diheme cytochrome c family protein